MSQNNQNYTKLEELLVYQKAMEVGEQVNSIVEAWDYYRKKTVGIQWVESTDSIGANIAEGVGRFFFKEKLRFMYYSRGSLLESKTWLQKATNRKWVTENQSEEMMNHLKSCHYLLNLYIKSIRAQNK